MNDGIGNPEYYFIADYNGQRIRSVNTVEVRRSFSSFWDGDIKRLVC